jgi:hypothetical protein
MRALVLILLALLVAGAAAYGLPLVSESAGTTCNALEKRFIAVSFPARGTSNPDPDLAALGRAFLGGLQNFSKGSFATEYALREYPNLPSGIGCVVLYWRTVVSPDTIRPRER